MQRVFFIILCILLSFALSNKAKTQNLPVHEQYMFDWVLLNPSFTGLTESTTFSLLHREQWVGVENSPRTSVFLVKRRLPGRAGGIGGYIYTDQNGASSRHGFMLSWSWQVLMRATRTNQMILSFGMSVKGTLHVLDESQFERHIYDPIITYSRHSSFNPEAGAGVLFSYSSYFAGVGLDNLIQYSDRIYNLALEPYPKIFLNTHAGGIIDLNPRMDIRPSSVFKTNFAGNNQLDINFKFKMFSGQQVRSANVRPSNEMWMALSYKQTLDRNNIAPLALSPSFGFAMGTFTFAYLYDLGLTALQLYNYGTHQISVGIRLFPDQLVNVGKFHVPAFPDDF